MPCLGLAWQKLINEAIRVYSSDLCVYVNSKISLHPIFKRHFLQPVQGSWHYPEISYLSRAVGGHNQLIKEGRCWPSTQYCFQLSKMNDLLTIFLRTNNKSLDSSVWDFLTLRDIYQLRSVSKVTYEELALVE